jgi:predicted Mrr-cat superfamily restriction endonuclease
MTTWLHRISHCGETSHPLLERGYLTIGFSDFSRLEFVLKKPEFISKSRQDGSYFDNTYREEWGGGLWRSRWGLWYFLAEMKTGDQVVVPGFPSQGSFSIFEIMDDNALAIGSVETAGLKTWIGEIVTLKDGLLSCNEKVIDLGFARKVRLIESGLSRSSFADAALTSRMKIRVTTADISNLEASVERAIEAFRSNRPINLHTTLLEQHTKATLDAICRELNDAKFEQLIAWYFRKVGATQVEIPAKNESGKEGDADIIATFEPLKTIIYVQAKKHTGETNAWAVEQIKDYRDKKDAVLNEVDAMDDGYSRIAWVVSTAKGFSDECSSLAKQNKILLLNGEEFVRLLLNAGIEGLDAAF